ncbi:MAG: DUF3943 domain-containing protein [Verrucomicrobia bacterium]|nr:DUF3943 domain-containing protein [Verrucomicrobiota bacterium]
MRNRTRAAAAIILLAISMIRLPVWADELMEPERVDFKKPFAYSLGLMSIGLPMLIGAGAFDEGPSINNFKSAFKSAPEWEDDSVVFNYVLHPLWGSETYLRAREANFGIPGSIAFSMGMSVTWEYLFESWVTHPSAQDLIFTTGVGWIIGELRYKMKQQTSEGWNWVLDPIHTTLEHLKVIQRTHDGEKVTMLAFSKSF